MHSDVSTLATLQALHPGVLLLDTNQVARLVGYSAKTIRNLGDRFPVPSLKLGDSRRFRLVDVAAAIDAGLGVDLSVPKPQPPKRGLGRPRKVTGGAA